MINSEETIGKVLAGLREAQASPGLERRILAAIEEHASVRRVATPQWTWSVALAGVVAIFLFVAITAIPRHKHPSTQAQQHVLTSESAGGTQEALLSPRKPITSTGAPARTATPVRKAQPISAAEAELFREVRAPSHPAPVAPLTQQEKLLLRAVHLGDPQVTAMLDPEVRARQEAVREAEFQAFVNQSDKDVHKSNQITE
jgi:hypothetical protein